MNHGRRGLIAALAFPILALAALAAYKAYVVTFGKEVVLPIFAYDPRDLLSGRYLAYSIDYGVADICVGANVKSAGYVCLEPKSFSVTEPADCALMIAGTCEARRFEAGIEKFFVPEDKAAGLEAEIRDKKASIRLSVLPNGHAQVKDLLIDGKSWKNR